MLLIFDSLIISTAYHSMNKVNTHSNGSLFNYIRYRRNPNKDFSIKSTTNFITINKSSLEAHFDIDNDVIILQNPAIINDHLVFKNDPFFKGSKITLHQQFLNFLQNLNAAYSKLSHRKLIVVCFKDEFCTAIKSLQSKMNFCFVTISNNNNNISNKDEYVILLVVNSTNQHNHQDHVDHDLLLDLDTIQLLKTNKLPNVHSRKGEKHNKSYGNYYGFGLINKYKVTNGLSFGDFSSGKKVKNDSLLFIEHKLRFIFTSLVSSMNETISQLTTVGNQLINSLIAFGKKHTNNNKFIDLCQKDKFGNQHYCSIWLCENARTELFHQELDASYTMITVPYVSNDIQQKSTCEYMFQFRWSNIDGIFNKGLNIRLNQGVSLYYNGYGLYHRQVPNETNFNSSIFWNMSMYHNKRLFHSINMSINRKNN